MIDHIGNIFLKLVYRIYCVYKDGSMTMCFYQTSWHKYGVHDIIRWRVYLIMLICDKDKKWFSINFTRRPNEIPSREWSCFESDKFYDFQIIYFYPPRATGTGRPRYNTLPIRRPFLYSHAHTYTRCIVIWRPDVLISIKKPRQSPSKCNFFSSLQIVSTLYTHHTIL